MSHNGRKAAITIGALILAQMAGSALVNFFAEAPLFEGGGFLVNASSHSQQIAIAVFLAIAIEATWVAIAILAFPILAERSLTSALALFAVGIVCLVIGVVENSGVMSMLSLSQAYSAAAPAERAQLEAARVIVSSARNWPHYLGRMFDGLAALTFYIALFRSAIVPRAISGLGILAVVSMLTGLSMPFFGQAVIFPMLAPLGLTQLALALWLIVKGFRARGARDNPTVISALRSTPALAGQEE
jgi:predicted neutral ceramidase superfamily lipid hydrolase